MGRSGTAAVYYAGLVDELTMLYLGVSLGMAISAAVRPCRSSERCSNEKRRTLARPPACIAAKRKLRHLRRNDGGADRQAGTTNRDGVLRASASRVRVLIRVQ